MVINEKTLKELDKQIKMIPLTYDFMFKSVFGRNLEVLKEFLVDVLELNHNLEELNIRILNNELFKDTKYEYQKRIDVNIVLNNNIYVEIEVNREDFELVKYRNKLYANKVSSLVLDTGDNIKKLKNIYFYQLNLNTKNKHESKGSHTIVLYDQDAKEV